MARPSTSLRLRITGPGIDVGPAPDSPHPERSRRARDVDAIPVAATSQQAKRVEISADQRLFLCARPSLDLAFGGNRVGDTVELLVIDQNYRAARRCVAAECPVIMLRDPHLQGTARGAGIIGAVRAAEEIKVGAQLDAPASYLKSLAQPLCGLRLRSG